MSRARQRVGQLEEHLVAQYLEAAGFEVVAHNYRCRPDEMDLVARSDETWVFVEVKTRRTATYGRPQEAITASKAARLLQAHGLSGADWRVDVIAIKLAPNGQLERLEHIENAVSGW